MELYLARDEGIKKILLTFPTTFAQVRDAVRDLEELGGGCGRVHIKGAEGPAKELVPYIRYTDLDWENGIDKLNELAREFDLLDTDARKLLFGALDMRIANSIYDVLETMSELDQYELICGAATDQALGGWLVEHGLAGVDFPEAVRPYLDYAGIGAEYKAAHSGTYTVSGYMERRENAPEQTLEDKSRLSLTLRSGSNTCRLAFPASDAELEAARRKLGDAELTDDRIDSILIGYGWASSLPLDDVTLEGFNTLAQCVQQMSHSELRLFGAALEAEEPETFSDADSIAENLDDYELVEGSEGTYGREALRYAGAGDEILDMLDSFTDFDALGRFEMEQDGVQDTSYGQVKRLSSPFPRQAEQGQTMC